MQEDKFKSMTTYYDGSAYWNGQQIIYQETVLCI